MIDIYPSYYKEFKCLIGECPNTCCKGWGIDIDKLTIKKYKNASGPYGAKLRQVLGGKKQVFKMGEKCPFLGANGLCEIQVNMGEDYLCDVCRTFPRLTDTYGKYREFGLSPACIEASKLIIKNKITFESVETNEQITEYNKFDSKILPYMIKVREFIFKVISGNLSFNKKLQFLMEFGNYLQENFRVYSNIESIISKFEEKLEFYDDEFTNHFKLKDMIKLIKKYLNLEMLTPYVYDKLYNLLHLIYNKRIKEEEFENFINYYRNINEFENIMTYFVYTYFLKTVYDYKISSRIKFALNSTIILIFMGIYDSYKSGYFDTELNIKNFEMFSREVEHSELNMKKLIKFFDKKTR